MKALAYSLLLAGLLYLCFEYGERLYWQRLAGCYCPDCIETYQEQQKSMKVAVYKYLREQ